MLLKGVSLLSNAELMAILISSGNKKETAVQLSQRILNSVSNNLNALGKLTVKELMTYKGIGEAKAITIVAAMELGKRRRISDPLEKETVKSSKNAFDIFYPLLCDLPHEELWVALTNSANKVIEKVKISQGGLGETSADLRFIMKAAINSTCRGIILCHNHPSGNLQPSSQDDLLTHKLKEAAKLLNINLFDHIIISDNKYYSYADEERI
jgi:DNA repair protein RadC